MSGLDRCNSQSLFDRCGPLRACVGRCTLCMARPARLESVSPVRALRSEVRCQCRAVAQCTHLCCTEIRSERVGGQRGSKLGVVEPEGRRGLGPAGEVRRAIGRRRLTTERSTLLLLSLKHGRSVARVHPPFLNSSAVRTLRAHPTLTPPPICEAPKVTPNSVLPLRLSSPRPLEAPRGHQRLL